MALLFGKFIFHKNEHKLRGAHSVHAWYLWVHMLRICSCFAIQDLSDTSECEKSDTHECEKLLTEISRATDKKILAEDKSYRQTRCHQSWHQLQHPMLVTAQQRRWQPSVFALGRFFRCCAKVMKQQKKQSYHFADMLFQYGGTQIFKGYTPTKYLEGQEGSPADNCIWQLLVRHS